MSEPRISRKDKKYKAVIIGAGRIACGFDNLGDDKILTHAHALTTHPRTVLSGIYDIDSKKASREAARWKTECFDDLQRMLVEVQPDIVSICTPDQDHFNTLMQVSKCPPGIIICEKPITTDLRKTKKIINIQQKKGIPVLINYSRRFDLEIQKLKVEITKGVWGKVVGANAVYTKGTLHNGSHLLDLCRFLFGEVKRSASMYARVDYSEDDPATGSFIVFEGCPQFFMLAGDERLYSIFELDILFEKGRVRVQDFGFELSLQRVVPDELYPGYQILGRAEIRKTKLTEALTCLIDNAVGHLSSGLNLLCTLDDAFKVQILCDSLIKNKNYVKR